MLTQGKLSSDGQIWFVAGVFWCQLACRAKEMYGSTRIVLAENCLQFFQNKPDLFREDLYRKSANNLGLVASGQKPVAKILILPKPGL